MLYLFKFVVRFFFNNKEGAPISLIFNEVQIKH